MSRSKKTRLRHFGPQPAERGDRDAQVGGDVSQVGAPADLGELPYEGFVACLCREREALLVAAVQPAVLDLVDDPAPVGQFDVRFEEPAERRERNAVGLDLLERLDELLARAVEVEFVHAEDDAALEREGGGDLASVHQPERAGQPPFEKVGVFVVDAFPDEPVPFREAAGRHARLEFAGGLFGDRVERTYFPQDLFHERRCCGRAGECPGPFCPVIPVRRGGFVPGRAGGSSVPARRHSP